MVWVLRVVSLAVVGAWGGGEGAARADGAAARCVLGTCVRRAVWSVAMLGGVRPPVVVACLLLLLLLLR